LKSSDFKSKEGVNTSLQHTAAGILRAAGLSSAICKAHKLKRRTDASMSSAGWVSAGYLID
jgi:hypothetical protein